MSKDDCAPTPEEMLAAVQMSYGELFEGAGATMKKVAEITARQLKAKKTVKVKDKEKSVPDWTQINIAAERVIRVNGAYAAEKQSNVITGHITLGWEE